MALPGEIEQVLARLDDQLEGLRRRAGELRAGFSDAAEHSEDEIRDIAARLVPVLKQLQSSAEVLASVGWPTETGCEPVTLYVPPSSKAALLSSPEIFYEVLSSVESQLRWTQSRDDIDEKLEQLRRKLRDHDDDRPQR
jgi:hypothetical protein